MTKRAKMINQGSIKIIVFAAIIAAVLCGFYFYTIDGFVVSELGLLNKTTFGNSQTYNRFMDNVEEQNDRNGSIVFSKSMVSDYRLINDEARPHYRRITPNNSILLYKTASAGWIVERKTLKKVIPFDYVVFVEGDKRNLDDKLVFVDIRATFSDQAYEEFTQFLYNWAASAPLAKDPSILIDKYIIKDDIVYPLAISVREENGTVTVFNSDIEFGYSDSDVIEPKESTMDLADDLILPMDTDYNKALELSESWYKNYCIYYQIRGEFVNRSRGLITYNTISETNHYILYQTRIVNYSDLLNKLTAIGCAFIILICAVITAMICHRELRKRKNTEYERSVTNALAHNYKSSLMIIRSCAENILAGVSEEKKTEYEQKIIDETDRMNESTEKILSFYRSGAAGYEPFNDEIDASKILRELIKKHENIPSEKGHEWLIDDAEKFIFEGDPILFSMALDNLVGNAGKYALPGSEIKVTTNRNGMIVKNNWNPIDKFIKRPRLFFEPFVTGSEAHSDSNSGIGLSVSKTLFERMGLHISAKPDLEEVTFEIKRK